MGKRASEIALAICQSSCFQFHVIFLKVINQPIMWLKQCHKPPIWEWFIPPIYGDLGDGLLLF